MKFITFLGILSLCNLNASFNPSIDIEDESGIKPDSLVIERPTNLRREPNFEIRTVVVERDLNIIAEWVESDGDED